MSVSSHPLILPALISPARLALLTRHVPRIAGRGVPRLVLISSCVPPTVMCVLLTALRSAHPRGAITDVIASPLRSAATVPPPTLLALSPRLFVSGGGEMSSGEVGSDAFSCGIFARSNALLVVLVLPYMPWRWGYRMRGIRARLHKLHLFTGRREFLLLGAVNLLGTASPLFFTFSVPLFSPPRSSCR